MTLLESGGGFTALSQRLAKKIASIALAWTFENGPMGRRFQQRGRLCTTTR